MCAATTPCASARARRPSSTPASPARSPQVIDSDYRGELRVALHNHSKYEQNIEPGERVAQLLILPYFAADFEETETLSDTDRGEGGFGSTGRA